MKAPFVALGLLAFAHCWPASGEVLPLNVDPQSLLPPEIEWEGQSLSLVADSADPWLTPAEASDFSTTPSYEETLAWLRTLVRSTRLHPASFRYSLQD